MKKTMDAEELRRKAEAKIAYLQADAKACPVDLETKRMLHELQVHKIELEMQNEELSQTRDEAVKALEMYSDLYDLSPVGYMTLDREGLILAANLTVAKLLGLERSRLIGRRFSSFLGSDAFPTFIDFINSVFANQIKEVCEVVLLSEDKPRQVVWIEAVATGSGEECRAAVIDISVRRELEETLQVLHTDLLAHAAQLEAANIELEAFNYTVAHDLRGPLTVIASYSEMVGERHCSKLDEQCRGYLRKIHDGTMHMDKIIDSLLAFSRIKSVEMRLEKVNLTEITEEVAIGLKMAKPERRVTFRIAKEVVAYGDASLIQIVMDNLMGNAWKYSGKREETVIEFDVTNVGGKPIYFIRDNGSGFDMEHAERLFIPFQRLYRTDVEGNGIGLATVDRIVRRHGGSVWAESKPGEGATFFFTLG